MTVTDKLSSEQPSVVSGPEPSTLSLLRMLLGRLLPRKKTEAEMAEEKAARQERQHQQELRAKLKAEAEAYAWQIQRTLEDLNVCYRYPKSKDDFFGSAVKRISFVKDHRIRLGPIKLFPYEVYGLTEEAIYLPVDLGPGMRPRGIGIEDLRDEKVLDNLSVNVGRKVHYWQSEADGYGYVIWRTEGINAVPVHVKYDDILASRPASADSLSVPIGEASGKRKIWRSLGHMVSMLVAGTTGGGKSNFLNVLIATLVNANSPARLRICLIDLKRGVEFTPWLGLPHVMDFQFQDDKLPAVIDRREEVVPCLTWLIQEGERRLDRIKECGVKNIGQYNSKHPRAPLARIVIVIDEWADIKLDPKIGPAAQELLINVASRFRAAGFSTVVCTQYPQKEVVSMRLKAVLPAKLAFAMPNIHASIMILNNDAAFGFSHTGRGIFQWGQEQLEVQVPLITNDKVDEIARAARVGEIYKAELNSKHDVSDEEILEWAVNQNNGKLDWRPMHAQFRSRGFTAQDAKNFGRDRSEQIFIVGASSYLVARPARVGEPWRLLPIDDDDKSIPESGQPGPGINPPGGVYTPVYTPDVEAFPPDEAQQRETITDAEIGEADGDAGMEDETLGDGSHLQPQ